MKKKAKKNEKKKKEVEEGGRDSALTGVLSLVVSLDQGGVRQPLAVSGVFSGQR